MVVAPRSCACPPSSLRKPCVHKAQRPSATTRWSQVLAPEPGPAIPDSATKWRQHSDRAQCAALGRWHISRPAGGCIPRHPSRALESDLSSISRQIPEVTSQPTSSRGLPYPRFQHPSAPNMGLGQGQHHPPRVSCTLQHRMPGLLTSPTTYTSACS